MRVILSTLGTTLAGLAFRLMTGKFFEELIIYGLKVGAKKTKVTWDDELVSIVVKHIEEKKNETK